MMGVFKKIYIFGGISALFYDSDSVSLEKIGNAGGERERG